MANTLTGTVYRVDTTGALPLAINVEGFKYVGGTGGSVIVRKGSASGNIVYESAGTTEKSAEGACLRSVSGLHVTVAGTAVLYVYLK